MYLAIVLLLAQAITGNVTVGYNFNAAPETYSARTDLAESTLSFQGRPTDTPPNVGGLTGAGTCITDPDFHSKICRGTDYSMNAYGISFTLGSQGKLNRWAVDDSKILVTNNGGGFILFSFNPTTMVMTPSAIFGNSQLPGNNYTMSSVDPNTFYELKLSSTQAQINKLVINNPTSPPSQWTTTRTQIVDFKQVAGCLPADFAPNWGGSFSVADDDNTFVIPLSDNGQNGAVNPPKYGARFVVGWRNGKGVRCIDTWNGTITGTYGPTGTWALPDRFVLHESESLSNSQFGSIGPGDCKTGVVCTCQPTLNHCNTYYWRVDTMTVNPCSETSCQGHAAAGYVYDYRAKFYTAHSYYDPSQPGESADLLPESLGPFDNHGSYNNSGSNDHAPVFLFTTYVCGQPNNPGARPCLNPYPQQWGNEVVAAENMIANPARKDCDYGSGPTGCVYRFAHNFNTGTNWEFSVQNAIGNVSPDGKFVAFSSDWWITLGCSNGTNPPCMDSTLADPATTCSPGNIRTNNCARADLFIVDLKSAH